MGGKLLNGEKGLPIAPFGYVVGGMNLPIN
jgi:hypothetical protein